MKPLAAAPLLATLIALPLQATPLREDALLSIGARTSGWQAEASGNLDTSVSLGADGLDVHRDIAQQMTLFIEHAVPLLPNLLCVSLHQGAALQLVVYGRADWCQAIRRQLG